MEEEIERFFRHCPACGRRFEIHLVGKELEEDNTSENVIMPPILSLGGHATRPGIYAASQPGAFRILKDSTQPTIIDAKDFDYTFKCGHCGHVWHEIRSADDRIYLPKGGTDELTTDAQDGPSHVEEEEDEAADMA